MSLRFITEDSRRFPNDGSWGVGIWYYGWTQSAVDISFGYRSFGINWRRNRRERTFEERLRNWLFNDPTWGFGIYRDPDGIWAISFGPWMHA